MNVSCLPRDVRCIASSFSYAWDNNQSSKDWSKQTPLLSLFGTDSPSSAHATWLCAMCIAFHKQLPGFSVQVYLVWFPYESFDRFVTNLPACFLASQIIFHDLLKIFLACLSNYLLALLLEKYPMFYAQSDAQISCVIGFRKKCLNTFETALPNFLHKKIWKYAMKSIDM